MHNSHTIEAAKPPTPFQGILEVISIGSSIILLYQTSTACTCVLPAADGRKGLHRPGGYGEAAATMVFPARHG